MVSLEQLLALTATSAVIIAVPGPSVLFVVGRALAHGRAPALASAAGNTVGAFAAACVIAVGLGPLLQQWENLLQVVKLAGAAYLGWLGVHAWRCAAVGPGSAPDPAGPHGKLAPWPAARAGMVVGATNPKVFVLFAAVLPQFVAPGNGSIVGQLLVLSVVPLTIGLVCDSAWALLAARARTAFVDHPRRLRNVARVGGISMIGLGVLTAATGRHR